MDMDKCRKFGFCAGVPQNIFFPKVMVSDGLGFCGFERFSHGMVLTRIQDDPSGVPRLRQVSCKHLCLSPSNGS